MQEIHWLSLGVFATLMLLVWLLVQPRKRVYFTAGFSGLAYGIMALSAPGVTTVTQTGTTVAKPVDPAIQFFVGVLSFLSIAVVFLYRWGLYPPEDSIANE